MSLTLKLILVFVPVVLGMILVIFPLLKQAATLLVTVEEFMESWLSC